MRCLVVCYFSIGRLFSFSSHLWLKKPISRDTSLEYIDTSYRDTIYPDKIIDGILTVTYGRPPVFHPYCLSKYRYLRDHKQAEGNVLGE